MSHAIRVIRRTCCRDTNRKRKALNITINMYDLDKDVYDHSMFLLHFCVIMSEHVIENRPRAKGRNHGVKNAVKSRKPAA